MRRGRHETGREGAAHEGRGHRLRQSPHLKVVATGDLDLRVRVLGSEFRHRKHLICLDKTTG